MCLDYGKLMEREILGEAGWKINHLEYETFANKNVIYKNREREGPFNINDVKRALHHQQCFEEYNAEIKNQYRKLMQTLVYVYEELKNSYTTFL